jgi:hypothetical protein
MQIQQTFGQTDRDALNFPGSRQFVDQDMNNPMYGWGKGMAAPVIGRGSKGYDRLINYMPILATRNRIIEDLMGELNRPQAEQPTSAFRQLAQAAGARGLDVSSEQAVLGRQQERSDLLRSRPERLGLLRELGAQYSFGPALAAHQAQMKYELKKAKKAHKKSKLGIFEGITNALTPSEYQGLNQALQTWASGG